MFSPTPLGPESLESLFTTCQAPSEIRHLPSNSAAVRSAQTLRELVIIDDGVSNWLQLARDIENQRQAGRAIDYVVLEHDRDGIEQISGILGTRQNLSAVHLVSHGQAGVLQLGTTRLTLDSLSEYTTQMFGWRDAFGARADLLVYGCKLAASPAGQDLVEALGILTGTDVAASDDLTGASRLGGDWALETTTGQVETRVAFTPKMQKSWNQALDILIDQAWLNARGAGPYYLDQMGQRYVLQTNVTTAGSAFAITNSDITFDLNGHTITYDNAPPIVVPNGSFEQGSGTAATGWNFSQAPAATRFAGVWLQNQTYDGSYSLRFAHPVVDQYVQSTSQVTLAANTTYSLSAMFQAKGTGGEIYVQLVNSSGQVVHEVMYTGNNSRGIQLTEADYTTGATAETYFVRAGARGGTGGFSYIDDIKIQRTKTYGVAIGTTGQAAQNYPGMTQFGYAPGATVVNGFIVQGADAATWGHGVLVRQSPDTTLDRLNITVQGANASVISWFSGSNGRVTNCNLTSNVRTITSRDNNHGAVVANFVGTFANNTIHNGVHVGLELGNAVNTVYGNTIRLKSKYSNAFAIYVRGDSEVYNNLIDCYQGDYAARGIFGRGTGQKNIHDNLIRVQALRNNQEYGGAMLGGVYGFQAENDDNIHFHHNTVEVYATEVSGYAVRIINGQNLSVRITDNTLRAVRLNPDVRAAALKLGGVKAVDGVSGLVVENNVFITNDQWLGSSDKVDGLQLRGNTLGTEGDASLAWWMETNNYNQDTLSAVSNLRFIDTQFSSAAAQTAFYSTGIWRPSEYLSNQLPDNYSSFLAAWTTSIVVRDGAAAPVANATVTVLDAGGATVASGLTDATGTWVVVLDQFRTQGNLRTTLTNYTVNVQVGSNVWTRAVSADRAQTVAFSTSGGSSANTAPILDNSGTMTFASLTENQTTNAGQSVASLIGSAGGDRITDPDGGTLEGIAVVGLNTGNGRWDYSLDNGASWTPIGAVTTTTALLLRSSDLLRFVPDGRNGTVVSLSFLAWDQTTGTAGSKVNATGTGGSTAFSLASETATLTVSSVNDAPVLDSTGTMSLPTVDEDQLNNSGQTIAAILASAGGDRVTDVDNGAVEGLALTALQNGNGWWQFSTDNGTTWQNVGTVSTTSALLLRGSDRVRFRPNGQNGTTASLTFRAWDQSSGTAGGRGDTTVSGGNTAWSAATETATIQVSSVNDAPTLDTSAALTLSAIAETDVFNPGNSVAQILASAGGDRLSDVDSGSVEGIAITASDAGNGNWQYSLDGGSTWSNLPAVSESAALLLRSSDWLRYVPQGLSVANPKLWFRGWDQTAGGAGTTVGTGASGGSSPFSTSIASAAITVNAVTSSPYVVQQQGTTLVVYGNEFNNYFSWSAYAPNEFYIDGYRIAIPTGVSALQFWGEQGTDTFQVTGTPGSDTLTASSTAAALRSAGWLITSQSAEQLLAFGEGGADTAMLNDSVGDDRFSAGADWAELSGTGFGYRLNRFATVTAQSGGQLGDEALLYDSAGNDVYTANPDSAQFEYASGQVRALGFRTTRGYSSAGSDLAKLYDSGGDDRLLGTLASTRMVGDRFFNNAIGFRTVQAFASGSATKDQVNLTATDATRVVVGAQGVELSDGTRLVQASGFRRQDIQGNTAPNAAVEMQGSDANDTYRGRNDYSTLQGGGFTARVNNFLNVVALPGSAGNDTAYLFDTAGDDVLQADGGVVTLSSGTYRNSARGFERTIAYGTPGQPGDVARFGDTSGIDQFWGYYDRAIMKGTGYETRAMGFAQTIATSAAGGNDSASLFDSAGNDNLVGDMRNLRLYGTGFDNRAVGFGTVYATASGSNLNDRLELSDSNGNDTALLAEGSLQLSGSGIWIQASGFGTQVLRSTAGGVDTLRLTVAGKDNTVSSYDDRLVWTRTGVAAQAWGFANTYVTVAAGSSGNRATFYNAATAESLRFEGNYGSYQSSSRLRRVEGFNQITAFYNPTNDSLFRATTSYALTLTQQTG